MVIDLTNLLIGNAIEVLIDGDVDISSDRFLNTAIKGLKKTHFKGSIIRLSDSDYQIVGVISGEMILSDDITLEDVIYPYEIEVEEDFNEFDDNIFVIIQNKLDIGEFLWQNILVEVPSKIRGSDEHLVLEGDGWRFVTEDDIDSGNDSPFSELSKMFDSGKE